MENRRNTFSHVFLMGVEAVAWSSRKHTLVALSTIKVEFVAVATCVCQAIWMRRILKMIGYSQ